MHVIPKIDVGYHQVHDMLENPGYRVQFIKVLYLAC